MYRRVTEEGNRTEVVRSPASRLTAGGQTGSVTGYILPKQPHFSVDACADRDFADFQAVTNDAESQCIERSD